jgi:plastocyanin
VSVTLSDFTISLDEDNFPAGAYELDIVNEGGSTHNVTVERDGTVTTATDGIDPGGSTTLAVTLETGEYVIYCSIANHRAMGMEITIEVT